MRGPPLDDGKLPQDIGKLKPSERHAHVMVERMATRAQAVKALRALSGQGEAPHLREDDTGEPSHFDRFVQIYQELKDVENEGWKPTHDVPTNPTIAKEFVETANARATKAKTAADWQEARRNYTLIKSACGNYFADLFNQRYRMLVTFLAHSFYLAGSHPPYQPSLRSMMMHRVFGEMYNLKTIAGLLVRLPLRDDGSGGCAAPPFQVPDDAILPGTDKEMWRLHLDLLDRAKSTCDHLLDGKNAAVRDQLKACGGKEYLRTLRDLDLKAKDWIEGVVAGLA